MKHSPTVLLIDDDEDDQDIFSIAMKQADKSVSCVFANDGIHALEKINSEKEFVPDYIFIDVNMPRMNGQQCLVEIKKIDRLKHVPVFMYSTAASLNSIDENKKLGAIDYIVKPSDINELADILSGIIRKSTFTIVLLMLLLGSAQKILAQTDSLPSIKELKRLTVEQLMNLQVTSVSKIPEKLTEVASAIQVITNEDIQRSTAMRLPEALRLATNLQVSQSGSHDWGISARGFNGSPLASTSLANKMLVMVDGRTVYTLLFGGVYWDVQNVLQEDIDHIEVVSGPGGTLWGANAVNGVINVMSKSAKETQGVYASGGYGSLLRDYGAFRYGSHVDTTLFFRVYGQRYDYNSTRTRTHIDARDNWNMTQGGFRMDYIPSDKNTLTVQGDLYGANEDDTLTTKANGQNILARWSHTFSPKSGLNIQTYGDRTWRYYGINKRTDVINTLDFDLQHHFSLGNKNRIVWGAGYRVLTDQYGDERSVSLFTPARKTLQLYNGFIQDQIFLVQKKLELTLGSKFLHNDYTGFEIQPSARIAWTPTDRHTLWAAVSRAVRTPSRLDVDVTTFTYIDHPAFKSEKVIAYELGYRMRPAEKVTFSLAGFYNQYDDLRSWNLTGVVSPSIIFQNDLNAKTWGVEFSANAFLTDWWRVRGGYTYFGKKITASTTSLYPDNILIESIDPTNQVLVQSMMDLTHGFQLDIIGRFVDSLIGSDTLKIASTPSYLTFNVRLAWEHKNVTVSLLGQNLSQDYHTETSLKEIPRSIFGKITLRF